VNKGLGDLTVWTSDRTFSWILFKVVSSRYEPCQEPTSPIPKEVHTGPTNWLTHEIEKDQTRRSSASYNSIHRMPVILYLGPYGTTATRTYADDVGERVLARCVSNTLDSTYGAETRKYKQMARYYSDKRKISPIEIKIFSELYISASRFAYYPAQLIMIGCKSIRHVNTRLIT
jgi:hypothetical protein